MENKKKKIIIGVVVTVLLIGLAFLLYFLLRPDPFQKYGFTESQRNAILKLSKQDQEYFLSHEDLWKVFEMNGYEADDLSRYIVLHKNPLSLPLSKIVTYVAHDYDTLGINFTISNTAFLDHPDFQKEYVKEYIAYRKNNPKAPTDAVIKIVNMEVDSMVPVYDDGILLILQEKYFIKDNLLRYLDYQEKNHTNASDTVTAVNVHLDSSYYSKIQSSDIEKGNLVLVNKYYALDKGYEPSDLVYTDKKYSSNGTSFPIKEEVYTAFVAMDDAIRKDGMSLKLNSLYRSYDTQKNLYQSYVNRDGKDLADTYSARAGHSEHQTGLAIDMTTFDSNFNSFDETEAFAWLQENAHKYGFILRYPEGKEAITGYDYEPWHYRYLGVEVATKVKESGLTYDEYYAYYIENNEETVME